MNLTVYFDGQFWLGLIEFNSCGGFYVLRHTFGAEPKDGELSLFVNSVLPKLTGAISPDNNHALSQEEERKISPKRMKKIAVQALKRNPVSTKSQEALQQQRELNKKESQSRSRQAKLELAELRRMRASEKAKQKHRGH